MRRWMVAAVIIAGGMRAVAKDPPRIPIAPGVYHEATCPSTDPSRMVQMTRAAAADLGSLPAPDCHPGERMRYLGISGAAAAPSPAAPQPVHVAGYWRQDGTYVPPHERAAPAEAKTVPVTGYWRGGTYVPSYDRAPPRPR